MLRCLPCWWLACVLPILTPICHHAAHSFICFVHSCFQPVFIVHVCVFLFAILGKARYSCKKSNENQLNIEQIFRPDDRFEIKQWAPLHQAEAPTSCRFYLSESLRSLFYPFLSLSLYSLKKSKFSILDIFISSSVSIDFFPNIL